MAVESYDQGDSLNIIYLDFNKAFDKVPYKWLIKKLEGYGIQENFLRWITEWLEDRKQRVQLNEHRSDDQRLEVMYHKGSDKFAVDTKIAS